MIVWVVAEVSLWGEDRPIGVAATPQAAMVMMKAEHPDRKWVAWSIDADGGFYMHALRPGHDDPSPVPVRIRSVYGATVYEVAE